MHELTPKSKPRSPIDVEVKYALGHRRNASGECLICTGNLAEDGATVVNFNGFYCRPCILALMRALKGKRL